MGGVGVRCEGIIEPYAFKMIPVVALVTTNHLGSIICLIALRTNADTTVVHLFHNILAQTDIQPECIHNWGRCIGLSNPGKNTHPLQEVTHWALHIQNGTKCSTGHNISLRRYCLVDCTQDISKHSSTNWHLRRVHPNLIMLGVNHSLHIGCLNC